MYSTIDLRLSPAEYVQFFSFLAAIVKSWMTWRSIVVLKTVSERERDFGEEEEISFVGSQSYYERVMAIPSDTWDEKMKERETK